MISVQINKAKEIFMDLQIIEIESNLADALHFG